MPSSVPSESVPTVVHDDAPQPLTRNVIDDRQLDPTLQVPSYDRSALTPGVVHMSVGGFHRAHQAIYFDELAEQGISTAWGIVGVGLHSRGLQVALAPQDGLYTVVERSAQEDRARVIGSVIGYHYAPEAREEVLAVLTAPTTQLVTMTITGEGYHVDRSTGEFDPDDEEIQHDLRHPHAPEGVFGYLVEALAQRRRAGVGPFTVLSCDNVPANGRTTRTAVVSFARLRDPALADWIADEVCFPNSMVDRITPQTTAEDREDLAQEFGVQDRCPVVTEPFSQWVIEDRFCADRPPLDAVGVQFVDDVTPFQTVKKRVLNGTHCAVGYLGALAGLRTTDEVLADPDLGELVVRMMREEIRPLLPQPPGLDLDAYVTTTVERLSNARMADGLPRLARRGSTKMADYLLPAVREAVERDAPRALLTLAVAAWIRYLGGQDDAGRPIEVQDPRLEELRALLAAGGGDPRPLLRDPSFFGALGDDAAFADAVERELHRLSHDGTRAAVRAALERTGEARAADAAATDLPAPPDDHAAPAGGSGSGDGPAPVAVRAFHGADLSGVRALLCDADGNLFPSEEPAFVASADVTNRFLASFGVDRRYEAEELRLATTGMNFRTTAVVLAVRHGVGLDAALAAMRPDAAAEHAAGGPGTGAAGGATGAAGGTTGAAGTGDGRPVLTADALEQWVAEERRAVEAYLGQVLRADAAVGEPLRRMAERWTLAAVSSSATPRLEACFGATDLRDLFPAERTFSAEDSLPRPTSKPDPAVYLHACAQLGVDPAATLAVEDSIPGAQSAVAAGCPTLGNVAFVAPAEREERIRQLRDVGVLAVVASWADVERLLRDGAVRTPRSA